MSNFLQLVDRRIVVFGMANRKSVAAHVGNVLTEAGAQVIHVVRSEDRREQIRKLVGDLPIHVCDVEHQDQIDRVRDEIATQHGPIQGFVHSLAFADFEVRHMTFKTRRGRPYRLLFTLADREARVLHVRGPGQDLVSADELNSGNT